jgi:hypothetical protein
MLRTFTNMGKGLYDAYKNTKDQLKSYNQPEPYQTQTYQPQVYQPQDKTANPVGTTELSQDSKDLWGGIQERFGDVQERIGGASPELQERFRGIEDMYRNIEEQMPQQGLYGEEDEYIKALQGATEGVQSDPIVKTIEQEITAAQKARDQVMRDLENQRTQLFNKEYENRELDKQKERMRSLDERVDDMRKEREDAILSARRNPNISAGVLTGETQKITDYYNQNINNEINKRNALAEQYNRELDEIEGTVNRNLQDLETQYDHWGGVIEQASGDLDRYTQALQEALTGQQEQSRWEREMAQDWEIAQMRNKESETRPDKMQVLTNPYTGEPVGLINPYTGERFPIRSGSYGETSGDSGGLLDIFREDPPPSMPSYLTDKAPEPTVKEDKDVLGQIWSGITNWIK